MIREKIAKLIDVKSLTTLLFCIAFVIMQLCDIEVKEPFDSILMMVISFYYGTQSAKKQEVK